MNKILKINSKQGSFDTSNKKFVDFTIPKDAVYNMKNSFINCVISLQTTDSQPNASGNKSGGEGVYNVGLGIQDDTLNSSEHIVPNVALVKNCFLNSQRVGKIDDIRRVDSLKTIQYVYEKDLNDKIDRSYYSLQGTKGRGEMAQSPFIRMEKEGSNNSKQEAHHLKIRMSELFDICNEELVDCNRLGDLEVHLEMKFDKLRARQELGSGDVAWSFVPSIPVGNTNKLSDVDNVSFITPPSGATDNINQLVASQVYSLKNFKEISPWYVGQKINIDFNHNVSASSTIVAKTDFERIITAIDFDNSSGKATLTLDSNLIGILTGDTLDTFSIVGVDVPSNNVNINIEKMEMVLEEVVNPMNVPNQYVYYTYDTEEDNHGNRQSVKKNYMIDSNCMNCYVGFGAGAISTLNTGILVDYRIAQNNEDVYNREVVYQSPLHYENISRTYMNNGRDLKSLEEQLFDNTETNVGNLDSNCEIIMFPTMERNDDLMSVLSIEANTTTAGINQMRIFQEKKKVV